MIDITIRIKTDSPAEVAELLRSLAGNISAAPAPVKPAVSHLKNISKEKTKIAQANAARDLPSDPVIQEALDNASTVMAPEDVEDLKRALAVPAYDLEIQDPNRLY